MEFWTFLWGCNTSIPMNCHVQLCGPFPTQSLHHCSSLLVCNVVCHHMSQGFHIMGSVMLQVCCVTSQGLSCHRFVVSHHRVCHAPGLLRHITGSVTGSVMLQVCCVTSQGLSCHSFVASHHRVCHRVCHAPGLLCHITGCLLYTSPSPRDQLSSRMPSSA